MKTMQKYKIDRNRLHKLIEKAGLRPTEFSESAGYNRSWLTKQIHDGEISRPAMVALEAAGIRYEEYMLLSPERGGGRLYSLSRLQRSPQG